MSNKRKPLSQAEERILIQSQLMGLDVQSMTRIANRLRAIKKEKHLTSEIQNLVAGFSWEDESNSKKSTYSFRHNCGLVFTVPNRPTNVKFWYKGHTADYQINMVNLTTGLSESKKTTISVSDDRFPAKLLPNRSKVLFGLICACRDYIK